MPAAAAAIIPRAGEVAPCAIDEARTAGLRYVSDRAPGIRRIARNGGFAYVAPSGGRVREERELARIKALAIPPAWTDVWICPHPRGHLQATGRDARGRKQYRYHAEWRALRDGAKFERLAAFARALPALRRRVAADQERPGLPREKVIATVVHLLETTLIRIGNDEYARQNGSYGLTTLRNRHVRIAGARLMFEFVGKGGKRHRIGVRSRRLSRIVRRCRELPGQELFQYVDDGGEAQTVGSADVNGYLREAMGADFTAKDFRTWQATVLTAVHLARMGPAASASESKRNINAAIADTADRLGNTANVCRKCYVHPRVIEAYAEGVTIPAPRDDSDDDDADIEDRLSVAERSTLKLLEA